MDRPSKKNDSQSKSKLGFCSKEEAESEQTSTNSTILTRPANPDELKLLELNRALHESRLKEKLGWKFPIINFLLLIGFSYGMYATKIGAGFGWFLFFWVTTIIVVIGTVNSEREGKRHSRSVLKNIAAYQQPCYVEVQIYQCNRALLIPDPEDLGDIHLLEIGNNQLLVWYDSSYEELGVLPVTEFEVYVNETQREVFNRRLLVTGERFQALSISSEISWDAHELIPKHGEIIEGTVDSFLEQLTQQYKSQ